MSHRLRRMCRGRLRSVKPIRTTSARASTIRGAKRWLTAAEAILEPRIRATTTLGCRIFTTSKIEKSPGAGDVTHNFVTEWVYDTPRLPSVGSSVVRQLLGTWQLGGVFSAATGEPLAITQATSLYHQRPDYVLGQKPTNDNWEGTPTSKYLNLQAFTQVPVVQASGAAARPGSLGWGAVRSPGFWNLNLSVGKNFTIREDVRLQLRADMLNALNKLNLSNIT